MCATKRHNYREYEIEFSGTVTVPFKLKRNQLGSSIEDAIRAGRKFIKSNHLDLLSPKITSGAATVRTVRAEQVVRPKTD